MRIYRITGQQNRITFTQNIKAVDYQDAVAKFMNLNTKFQDYNYWLPEPLITRVICANRRLAT